MPDLPSSREDALIRLRMPHCDCGHRDPPVGCEGWDSFWAALDQWRDRAVAAALEEVALLRDGIRIALNMKVYVDTFTCPEEYAAVEAALRALLPRTEKEGP